MKEGISPGMALAAAERKVKNLTVLPPDPAAYETMNKELERIAAVYAPAHESDNQGNMYLDLTGTAGLFGPPADCSSRILREMLEQTGMRPAAAVAGNKLVCKVASRAIRPVGLIQIPAGAETAFLAHQDIGLLPGMGPGLLRTAAVTGFREIGELARLNDGEALALFGKRVPLLRDTLARDRYWRKSRENYPEGSELFNKDITNRATILED
jgi:DNA polymerase-4